MSVKQKSELNGPQGQFAPVSMLPKVEAALSFVESGGKAVITSPGHARKAIEGEKGHINGPLNPTPDVADAARQKRLTRVGRTRRTGRWQRQLR
jgi:hypothetical protein